MRITPRNAEITRGELNAYFVTMMTEFEIMELDVGSPVGDTWQNAQQIAFARSPSYLRYILDKLGIDEVASEPTDRQMARTWFADTRVQPPGARMWLH